jgi:ketopantoate reductase
MKVAVIGAGAVGGYVAADVRGQKLRHLDASLPTILKPFEHGALQP